MSSTYLCVCVCVCVCVCMCVPSQPAEAPLNRASRMVGIRKSRPPGSPEGPRTYLRTSSGAHPFPPKAQRL